MVATLHPRNSVDAKTGLLVDGDEQIEHQQRYDYAVNDGCHQQMGRAGIAQIGPQSSAIALLEARNLPFKTDSPSFQGIPKALPLLAQKTIDLSLQFSFQPVNFRQQIVKPWCVQCEFS